MTDSRQLHFNKVAIIGVGLIGGSLAMVMREKGIAGTITGIGRGIKNLEAAKRLGVVDSITQEIEEGVIDADLVVVAIPVMKTADVLKKAAPHLKTGCIVTDVGSVKHEVIESAQTILPKGVRFVAGHPIAGTEHSGVEAAFKHLFEGKNCILTPTNATDKAALEQVKSLWLSAGSNVVLMDAELHDWTFAAASHLPHIIAYTLVNTVALAGSEGFDLLKYSAGGFRDFTRIASSSPEMWRDVCGMNKGYIMEMLDSFQKRLDVIKKCVQNSDLTTLQREFEKAKKFRDSIAHKHHEGCSHHGHGHVHGHEHEH
ncbi:MAG: prephenate dehydrogenase/arogenate dehydrogenase family protein [Deltaproteobacteria bacterium]|nr:prephenate dehydrogenase/arogenate dehydrogenase family protein [Deltaproteobacteria bacterium]